MTAEATTDASRRPGRGLITFYALLVQQQSRWLEPARQQLAVSMLTQTAQHRTACVTSRA